MLFFAQQNPLNPLSLLGNFPISSQDIQHLQQQLQQQQQNLQNLQQMLLLQSGQLAPNIQAMLLQNQGLLQLRQSLQALSGTQGMSLPSQDSHPMQQHQNTSSQQQRDGSASMTTKSSPNPQTQQHQQQQPPSMSMSHLTKAHLTNQALIKQQQQTTIDRQSSPLSTKDPMSIYAQGKPSSIGNGINDPSPEEMTDLEELEQFAKTFKQRRIKLGMLLQNMCISRFNIVLCYRFHSRRRGSRHGKIVWQRLQPNNHISL